MSSLIVRRRLQARRERRSAGAGPWLIAGVGLLAFGAILAAGAAGALFGMYNSYAHDYVPIEEKLLQRAVGLTTIYDDDDVITDIKTRALFFGVGLSYLL